MAHNRKAGHPDQNPERSPSSMSVSRRRFLKGTGAAGVVVAAAPLAMARGAKAATPATPDGTPEQIHLTWGEDPTRVVVVSWASAAQAVNPRIQYGHDHGFQRTVAGVQRTYTDGLNGQTVFTYHARLDDLQPDSQYQYSITADNDSNSAQPFSASFQTAPKHRARFRWTSFGDLATPVTAWVLSYPQSAYAVQAVEQFKPLFHLLNGDLCYANLNPSVQPAVWADFGNNNQASAAFRPWMPCVGNHEIEFNNGAQGFTSYLTRYTLPDNGTPFPGRWYSFRVGSALFISLSADDVIYQDGGAFVAGPNPLTPAASTGNPAIEPGTSFYIAGYSGGAQTRWLEKTLREAHEDDDIDWIIVQMHQDASRLPRRATAPTWGSARPGCRCSIATASTWCSAVTTMTTSAAGRCEAATTTSGRTRPPAQRSTPASRARWPLRRCPTAPSTPAAALSI